MINIVCFILCDKSQIFFFIFLYQYLVFRERCVQRLLLIKLSWLLRKKKKDHICLVNHTFSDIQSLLNSCVFV